VYRHARAGAGNALPFLSLGGNFAFEMPSPLDPAIKNKVQTVTRLVGPDYFQVLRLRLIAGRTLNAADTLGSRPVIVVNRTFARQYLGKGAPRRWIRRSRSGPARAGP
jgi:hypothetical protein